MTVLSPSPKKCFFFRNHTFFLTLTHHFPFSRLWDGEDMGRFFLDVSDVFLETIHHSVRIKDAFACILCLFHRKQFLCSMHPSSWICQSQNSNTQSMRNASIATVVVFFYSHQHPLLPVSEHFPKRAIPRNIPITNYLTEKPTAGEDDDYDGWTKLSSRAMLKCYLSKMKFPKAPHKSSLADAATAAQVEAIFIKEIFPAELPHNYWLPSPPTAAIGEAG